MCGRGGHILVDDGLVDLEVQDISGKDIVCKVINAGVIATRRVSMFRVQT